MSLEPLEPQRVPTGTVLGRVGQAKLALGIGRGDTRKGESGARRRYPPGEPP